MAVPILRARAKLIYAWSCGGGGKVGGGNTCASAGGVGDGDRIDKLVDICFLIILHNSLSRLDIHRLTYQK